MPNQEDIVVVKYVADVAAFKTALDSSNKKLGEQGAIVDQNGKKITALNNNFKETGQQVGESIMKGSKAMKTLENATDSASKVLKDAFKTRLIQDLNKALKETENQLSKISTTGVLFKALALEADKLTKELDDLTKIAPTLKEQYKAALLDVQNGVEGAAERAGQLKDQIDDANEAVGNLASGSKLEQFGSQLGTVTGKLAALDFEGAADAAKQLGTITSQISVKETLGQIKNLGSTLLNTLGSLINPSTLAIAALSGIGYVIYSLITAEDAEVKKLKELAAVQNERFNLDEVGYENEINLLKASGRSYELVERKKLESKIKNTKTNLELSQKIYELERENAIKGLTFVYGREKAEKMVRDKELGGENEKYNKKLELEIALSKAENALQVDRIETTKGFQDVLLAGAKTNVEKRIKIQTSAAKIEKKIVRENIEEFEIIEAKKVGIITASTEQIKTIKTEDYEANLKLLEDSLSFEQGTYDTKQKMLDEALANNKISLEQHQKESQELKDEEFQKDLERYQKGFESAAFFVNQLDGINAAVNQIQENRLREGEKLTKQQQQAQFNREKALNIAQAGINGAQAVMKAIAQFGPPPSPLGIAGIASAGILTALQIGAIASKQFVPLAEGTPLVAGGIKGKDSVPAMLMPDERVVPVKDNMKHWDDLEAMRKGNFDAHVRMKYIVPALRDLNNSSKGAENESFANNIANSLMTNGTWKGQNIVRALSQLDDSQRDNTKILVKAFKSNVSNKKRVS